MKPKYAVYCRASTRNVSHQGHSIEGQKETLLAYAHKLGLSIAGIFIDIGSAKKPRTQFQKMLATIQAEKVSGILTSDISRLARNVGQMKGLVTLMEGDILHEVRTPKETFTSASDLSLHGALLEQYHAALSRNTKRGMEAARLRKLQS